MKSHRTVYGTVRFYFYGILHINKSVCEISIERLSLDSNSANEEKVAPLVLIIIFNDRLLTEIVEELYDVVV